MKNLKLLLRVLVYGVRKGRVFLSRSYGGPFKLEKTETDFNNFHEWWFVSVKYVNRQLGIVDLVDIDGRKFRASLRFR